MAVAAVLLNTFDTESQLDQEEIVDANGDKVLQLYGQQEEWYRKARLYRQDPTVALARAILAAPILQNRWSISGKDQAAVELVKLTLLPHRQEILRHAVFSGMDYGWMSWEVRPQKIEGTRHIRMKPLKHDYTQVESDKDGFPIALRNKPVQLSVSRLLKDPASTIDGTQIKAPYFSICAAADEYNDPYGYPLLKNVESIMESYAEVEEGARRYIKKTAGSHWVLWYPEGITVTINGEEVDSSVVATRILTALKASGSVALPVSPAELKQLLSQSSGGGDVRKSGWDLKLMSDGGGVDPFLERQAYLDALKMRAMFVPERTALEGHFGTKAESSEHADIAMMAIGAWGESLIEWINSPFGFISNILAFNKIPYYPGRVRVDPLPLVDDTRAFFREIFRTAINNVEGFARIIDVDAIANRTDVPIDKDALEMVQKQAEEQAALGLEAAKAGIQATKDGAKKDPDANKDKDQKQADAGANK